MNDNDGGGKRNDNDPQSHIQPETPADVEEENPLSPAEGSSSDALNNSGKAGSSEPKVPVSLMSQSQWDPEVRTDVHVPIYENINNIVSPTDSTRSKQNPGDDPEYEEPISCGCSSDNIGSPADSDSTRPLSSPIYSTVVKPSSLDMSISTTSDISNKAKAGSPLYSSVTTPSPVVSYASTMVIPVTPVGEYPILHSLALDDIDWLPKVPKKQRCVQVSVMDEDLRTTRREMLLCDIGKVTAEDRRLNFVNTEGNVIYRTSYDTATGAYGIILDDENTLKRRAETGGYAACSRFVGCLFKTHQTQSRDVWELRDADSGATNAMIKIRKWNGFVNGCMHVNRSDGDSRKFAKRADIKVRRVRGSSDVMIAAVLNDQVITTIRRETPRSEHVSRVGEAVKGNLQSPTTTGVGSKSETSVYSLFIAPYIDSVAVISLFLCVSHIQLRYDRPRTTLNIIAILLAKEARAKSKSIGENVSSASKSLSKNSAELSKSFVTSLKEAEIELKEVSKVKSVKIGTFSSPQFRPPEIHSPKIIRERRLPQMRGPRKVKTPVNSPPARGPSRVVKSPVRLKLEREKIQNQEESNAKLQAMRMLKSTEKEFGKVLKQTEEGIKRVSAWAALQYANRAAFRARTSGPEGRS